MLESSVISRELLDGKGLYLAQAAKLLPRYRRDRPVSPSTLFRWIHDGVRLKNGERLRLEAVRISGKFVTTQQALSRFLDQQSTDTARSLPTIRTSSQRAKAQQLAAARLETDFGI
jgi:hypothetical protein